MEMFFEYFRQYSDLTLMLRINDAHNTIQHHLSQLPGMMFRNVSPQKNKKKKRKGRKKGQVLQMFLANSEAK